MGLTDTKDSDTAGVSDRSVGHYLKQEKGIEMKTSELKDADLDYWVAKCEGADYASLDFYVPSLLWDQGGPIIEREGIKLYRGQGGVWWSASESDPHHPVSGPTPLVAAMRCYVASILGDEVEVPD